LSNEFWGKTGEHVESGRESWGEGVVVHRVESGSHWCGQDKKRKKRGRRGGRGGRTKGRIGRWSESCEKGRDEGM